MIIAQLGIAICGVTAGQRRVAYLILALCLLYTVSWASGFHSHWVKPWMQRRAA